MGKLEKIKEKFKQMFGLDLRSLALFRVLFGLLILLDLFQRVKFIAANYTDTGVMPRSALLGFYQNSWVYSLYMLSGKWQVELILFIIAAVFAVMLVAGYKTKLATIASWIMLNSLQARNPFILHGGDDVMKLALFWAMFLPWGKYFSVDRALALAKGRATGSEGNFLYISGSSIAYILQISFIYWFTFLVKSMGPEWRDGTAVYFALSLNQFAMPLAHLLLHFPPLLTLLNYSTLTIESLGPFLFISPIFTGWVRLIGVFAFIFFHVGLGLGLHLGLFPVVCIIALIALPPGLFWDLLQKFLAKRKAARITVYYDGECGFCKKSIQFIKVFCLIPSKNILPASANPPVFSKMVEHNSWVIVDQYSNYRFGFDGFKTIFAASPFFIFSPLLNIPPITAFGNWAYRQVSSHHKMQCLPELPKPQPRLLVSEPVKNIILSTVAGVMIFYIFLWNIMTVAPRIYVMPAQIQNIGVFLRIDQYWNLFAPSPWRDDGWYVIPGQLNNGQTVDVYRNGAPVSYNQPKDVATTYAGTRWRKYLLNLWVAGYANYRQYYGQYLCRTWNSTHPASQQLVSLQIIYMLDRVQPDYQPRDVQPTTIWQGNCSQ